MEFLTLILSLLAILAFCELFTNAVEWLGKNLNFGHSVVGSVFSAVSTALPETIVPIIALITLPSHASKEEIGIGAILGAPLMLSTLTFSLLAIPAFFRKDNKNLNFKKDAILLDIKFFIFNFSIALFISVFAITLKYFFAIFFLISYLFYIYMVFKKDEGFEEEDLHPLLFFKSKEPGNLLVFLQLGIGLCGILLSSYFFVTSIESISKIIGLSPFIVSVILSPIATELPEKFNSISWIIKGKDHLAISNITGAMVFQSSFPIMVGLILSKWQLDEKAFTLCFITIFSSLYLYSLIKRGSINPKLLFLNFILYVIYILISLNSGARL
ncbi:sodium/calcium exchanger membrane region [Thermodesulfobium narugense DSM 14796]|uniref:Sodium/calcium exchanger membrane region n=2 Tax=Thermodesulfobium narugense TaxID=184064 RepID=M1E513_9BACT|nr:sodium/calcium exchanger membrane region [Thermodesulfobium narugense DSM 14796]